MSRTSKKGRGNKTDIDSWVEHELAKLDKEKQHNATSNERLQVEDEEIAGSIGVARRMQDDRVPKNKEDAKAKFLGSKHTVAKKSSPAKAAPAKPAAPKYDDEYVYEEDFEDFEDASDAPAADAFQSVAQPAAKTRPAQQSSPNRKKDSDLLDLSALDSLKQAMATENARIQPQEWPKREPTGAAVNKAQAAKVDLAAESFEVATVPAPSGGRYATLDEQSKKHHQTKHISEKGVQRMQRAKELSKLIDLDFGIFTIFEMAPLNEYDLYIKSFGTANSHQVAVQTHDDYEDRDTQTDEWFVEDKWVQNTPDTLVDVGVGCLADSQQDGSASTSAASRPAFKVVSVTPAGIKFLRRATKVVEDLLDEQDGGQKSGSYVFEAPVGAQESFSKGVLRIPTERVVVGRSLVSAALHPVDSQIVVLSWTLSASSAFFKNHHIVVLSNISGNSASRILLAGDLVTTVQVSRVHPHLVFGGTQDGSLVVWDLKNEDASLLHSAEIDGCQHFAHFCSYDTSAQYTLKHGHEDRIVLLKIHEHASAAPGETTSRDHSFKLVSVDAGGVSQHWVALFLAGDSTFDDFETDHGLAINSRVRLIRNGYSSLSAAKSRKHTAESASVGGNHVAACVVAPQNPMILVAATEQGLQKESRTGDAVYPRSFAVQPTFAQITCVDFSPFFPHVFLVGSSDGTLALHTINDDRASSSWKFSDSAIRQVCWSPSRAAVFYALDSGSVFGAYDLTENGNGPVVYQENVESGALCSFSLAARSDRKPKVLLSYSTGDLHLHLLSDELHEEAIDEGKVLLNFAR